MTKLQLFAASLSWVLIASPLLCASDLSRYREFDLDSNLLQVATKAGTEPEEAKTIHERPALIQELSWRADFDDSVNAILFSFYDGQLFQMVVDYDRYTTEGLTAQDVIEAMSLIYGETVRPAAEVNLPTITSRNEPVAVIARWEDADWSFNLVRLEYQPNFTLVAISKRLGSLARAAIDAAVILDKQEAPQRRIDQKKRDDDEKAAALEQKRLENKAGFRP